MRSTMFLTDLTVIDHAYIDPAGFVIGGSFNPSFLVSGEVTEDESVVVDFSSIKKEIKALIDHPVLGLDHKLWILADSAASYPDFDSIVDPCSPTVIDTDYVSLVIPRSAVCFLPAVTKYSATKIGEYLSSYLTDGLSSKYPGLSIKCFNAAHTRPLDPNLPTSLFTYVHGLKDSTSWGCQNNSHGHLSFLQLHSAQPTVRDCGFPLSFMPLESERNFVHARRVLQNRIACDLDGTIFVNAANILPPSAGNARKSKYSLGDVVEIEYTTPRGTFYAAYTTRRLKIVVLPTETTIEYLADYVCTKFRSELNALGVTAISVSEGLNKGAYIEVTSNVEQVPGLCCEIPLHA